MVDDAFEVFQTVAEDKDISIRRTYRQAVGLQRIADDRSAWWPIYSITPSSTQQLGGE